MITDHRLKFARRIDSPNCSERPERTPIDLLVIHNISLPPGEYGGRYIEDLFCNSLEASGHSYFAEVAHLRVSSHLLIHRDGELTQFVPFDRQAWHAGASTFCGREKCNEFSIGIELEGSDYEPFTEAQYESLVLTTEALLQHYPQLAPDRIVGHSDIAPGRKTDPGPHFDWKRYLKALYRGDKQEHEGLL